MRFFNGVCLTLALGVMVLHSHAALAAGTGAIVATADMDGSGNTDMVALDPADQQVDVLWVSSDGNFTVSTQAFDDIADMAALAVADLNGDGKPDVVICDGSGSDKGVRVLLNNGDGTLAADQAYASDTAAHAGPVSVTVADVNGDGWPDIVTANGSAGTVSVLLNHGDGTFAAPQVFPAGADPVAVAVADLDGDGLPDLVLADHTGDSVQLMLNDGLGGFAAPAAQAVGVQPVAVTVADVDGDGHLDVLVADQGDNTVGTLLGHGDGSFEPAAFYHTGVQPGWIAVQDLNGDGLPDVLTDNYSDGSVSLFANSGHGFDAQQQLFPAYGSYGTVVMDIGGKPQVVSPNVRAGQVQVTPAAVAVHDVNAAQGTVRQIQGAQDPQSSGGKGTMDGLGLVLLGLVGLFRSRIR